MPAITRKIRIYFKKLLKQLRYVIEAVFVYIIWFIFKIMGMRLASWAGSKIAPMIGKYLKANQYALHNLQLVMPEKAEEHEQIINEMWQNLGRTAAEFPHISSLTEKKFSKFIAVEGVSNAREAMKSGKGFIFFSAHLANWEVEPQTAYVKGFPVITVYRKANNPYVEWLIQRTRGKTISSMLPKGKRAARGILEALKAGKPVAMLVDQKFNEGEDISFFGHNAKTATAIAEYAMKFDVPLIPTRVVRFKGCNFRVIIDAPIETKNRSKHDIMTEINLILEGWIRENPEQWFWVHRRWGK